MNFLAPLIKRKAVYGGAAGGSSYPGGSPSLDIFGRDRAPSAWTLVRENLGTSYACATLNSSLVAKTTLRLYIKNGRGKRPSSFSKCGDTRRLSYRQCDWLTKSAGHQIGDAQDVEEVTQHPALDLLDNPNVSAIEDGVALGRYGLLDLSQRFLEIVGRGYWYMEGNGRLGPKQIWVLPPQYTTEHGGFGPDAPLIDHYTFSWPNGGTNTYGRDEIMPLRFADLSNPYLGGMSPLRACFEEVKQLRQVTALTNARIANGGRPDSMWNPRGDGEGGPIGVAEASRMRSAIRQNLAQAGAGGVIVAEYPGVLTPISWPRNDIIDAASFKLDITRICYCFGTPDSLLMSENANLAAITAARSHHALNMMGRMRALEEALTKFFIPFWDDSGRLFFKFDKPEELHDPATEKVETDRRAVLKANGVITANEYRRAEGMDEVPWGDQPYGPATLVPLLPDGKPDPAYGKGAGGPPLGGPGQGAAPDPAGMVDQIMAESGGAAGGPPVSKARAAARRPFAGKGYNPTEERATDGRFGAQAGEHDAAPDDIANAPATPEEINKYRAVARDHAIRRGAKGDDVDRIVDEAAKRQFGEQAGKPAEKPAAAKPDQPTPVAPAGKPWTMPAPVVEPGPGKGEFGNLDDELNAEFGEAPGELAEPAPRESSTDAKDYAAPVAGSLGGFKPADEARQSRTRLMGVGEWESGGGADYAKDAGAFAKQSAAWDGPTREALTSYVGGGYGPMNDGLRADPRVQAGTPAARLQAAVESSPPTDRDMVLYRGTRDIPKGLIPAKAGDVVQMNGFMSTGSAPIEAFAAHDGHAFEIHVPKGSKGVMSGFNEKEAEHLVKHGAKLKYMGSKVVPYQSHDSNRPAQQLTHFFEYVG